MADPVEITCGVPYGGTTLVCERLANHSGDHYAAGHYFPEDSVGMPKHYFAGNFECGNIVDALLPRWTASGLDSHRLAAAFEYLFRCGSKDNPRQDAEKALNYLHRALYGKWFPFTEKK